ncbi:MAG: hypothetical protein K9G46_01795 [Flavobacteriales bacterium]|nr:hypothetical protein [Flavobacteriales bacterium]
MDEYERRRRAALGQYRRNQRAQQEEKDETELVEELKKSVVYKFSRIMAFVAFAIGAIMLLGFHFPSDWKHGKVEDAYPALVKRSSFGRPGSVIGLGNIAIIEGQILEVNALACKYIGRTQTVKIKITPIFNDIVAIAVNTPNGVFIATPIKTVYPLAPRLLMLPLLLILLPKSSRILFLTVHYISLMFCPFGIIYILLVDNRFLNIFAQIGF